MTRSEYRRRICKKLARRIAEVTPAGLGTWDEAWEIVADPSNRFLDALSAFLESDTRETRRVIQEVADELVRAWRRAGQAWRRVRPPWDEAGRHEKVEERT